MSEEVASSCTGVVTNLDRSRKRPVQASVAHTVVFQQQASTDRARIVVSSNRSAPPAHSATSPARCLQIPSASIDLGNDARQRTILSSPNSSPSEFKASETPSVYMTTEHPFGTVTRCS